MDAAEINRLIASSFLSPDAKAELSRRLDKEGLTGKFYADLSASLIGEIERRGNVFEKAANGFDAAAARISAEFELGSEEAADKATSRLAGIDPADLAAKKEIWDEYYGALEALRADYEKKMNGLIPELLTAVT